MAANKSIGDNPRKGAVRKHSQLATKIEGEDTWSKRSKDTGECISQNKAPAKNKYRGLRLER